MAVSSNIDWISATFPFEYHLKKWQSAVLPPEKKLGVPVKSNNGYTEAYKFPSGVTLQTNSERPDMGVHVIYSASAIANVFNLYECNQETLLKFTSENARISRLDVCIDVSEVEIDILALYHNAKNGDIKTRSKSISFVESAKIGKEKGACTMYIGSQKKRKKLLRVYDKGEQLGITDFVTRFELETRGMIADNASHQLTSIPYEDYGEMIAGMIKAFADFSATNVGEYFEVERIPIKLPKYTKSNTSKWLTDVVSKTLAREALLDECLLGLFFDAFQHHYEKALKEQEEMGGV